jgi:hypothetical protein
MYYSGLINRLSVIGARVDGWQGFFFLFSHANHTHLQDVAEEENYGWGLDITAYSSQIKPHL